MLKRWNILQATEEKINLLQQSLKISKSICKILTQRGIDDFEKAKDFFRPQLAQLHSPWLMKDMDKAVERILSSFKNKEKILVFGDYDVDGTTSVATMFSFLQNIYPHIDFYIPHRYREGYGVSKQGIDFAAANNISLIIALDCGIKSNELISYAKDICHIDFIVCDHHLPDTELPPAVAILNAKQIDCNYPFKELCGCGVGFKLMQALAQKLHLADESYLQYLDLVATAIAADIVDMTGENRILSFYGLKKINENPSVGLKALLEISGAPKKLTVDNVVFIAAPRINAAGRMDDARKAVQLFIEKDFSKAKEMAMLLQSDNTDRREADSSITEEALQIINEDEILKNRNTTVVYKEHWHKGVVGIVASRLIETYYRPTVVLTKSGDTIAGSARSVPGVNLYEAIYACRQHLLGYGGHFAAAGLSLLPENLDSFIKSFENVVSNTIDPQLLIPEIKIDAEIKFSEYNKTFYNIINQMEPFGPGNMKPVFISRNVFDSGYSSIVKEKHIRFSLKQDEHFFNGIGFNMSEKFELLKKNKPLDIVYHLELNEWNGESSLRLRIIDLKLSEDFNKYS